MKKERNEEKKKATNYERMEFVGIFNTVSSNVQIVQIYFHLTVKHL